MSSSSAVPLVDACRALDPEPIADLTLDLTRIWAPPGDEAKMADRMAEEWNDVGARVTIDRQFPSSPSVIAEFGATGSPRNGAVPLRRDHGER